MREEIRLGTEALARNNIETAKQHFLQLLVNGGTPLQEQIATNRLRDIREGQEAGLKPPPSKPRTRRKATGGKTTDSTAKRKFVHPPEQPVVVSNKH